MLNKEKIKNSFSRFSKDYDRVSDFQKETGHRIIDMILRDGCCKDAVLDIGTGPGTMSQELADSLGTNIYGCDIAWGMVSLAKTRTRNIFINQADAEELPFRNEAFGMIFSNITYQWVRDFKRAFLEIKRVLKKGGRFYFSILAKDSLKELYQTIELFFKSDLFGDFLPDGNYINDKLMEAGLRVIREEDIVLKRYYESCSDLLKTLKEAGAGKVLEPHLFGMGKRKLFFDMMQLYDNRFREKNKVFATYKVAMRCVEK
jgi:malonyl-CoA O-methyltransferase